MTERLALFPLGTVLLPGLLLPLKIFEHRYRVLVAELLDLAAGEPRRFGVVAIRHGRETGTDDLPTFHEIGCTANIRRIDRHTDGRFSIIASGGAKFRVLAVDRTSRPYLTGDVEYLSDGIGDAQDAAAQVPVVTKLLHDYAARLSSSQAAELRLPDLPDDPRMLSYIVAASVVTQTAERQALLAAPDAAARLRAERMILRRELGLLERFSAIGSDEHIRVTPSPN
ncbi:MULTISPECIES: LON peptidase substrate-binding domain-containing protein [unclassified Frankia]|uniref:LON peptidase substrate-binding domain-containing protein n=1 Tax=unclassified Frankia TaxID=2632575 RepID=UPI002AD33483|nr:MULTISPECIES: LON peptidase substrate-binding domain-containing protein [unclassified Frankia]